MMDIVDLVSYFSFKFEIKFFSPKWYTDVRRISSAIESVLSKFPATVRVILSYIWTVVQWKRLAPGKDGSVGTA